MTPNQSGQRLLQACRLADASLTHLSLENNRIGDARQRVLQECWDSVQCWLRSISAPMDSKLSGKGGFELRGVVKPLALICRYLTLLAR